VAMLVLGSRGPTSGPCRRKSHGQRSRNREFKRPDFIDTHVRFRLILIAQLLQVRQILIRLPFVRHGLSSRVLSRTYWKYLLVKVLLLMRAEVRIVEASRR